MLAVESIFGSDHSHGHEGCLVIVRCFVTRADDTKVKQPRAASDDAAPRASDANAPPRPSRAPRSPPALRPRAPSPPRRSPRTASSPRATRPPSLHTLLSGTASSTSRAGADRRKPNVPNAPRGSQHAGHRAGSPSDKHVAALSFAAPAKPLREKVAACRSIVDSISPPPLSKRSTTGPFHRSSPDMGTQPCGPGGMYPGRPIAVSAQQRLRNNFPCPLIESPGPVGSILDIRLNRALLQT